MAAPAVAWFEVSGKDGPALQGYHASYSTGTVQ
jgi:hypothetical protein